MSVLPESSAIDDDNVLTHVLEICTKITDHVPEDASTLRKQNCQMRLLLLQVLNYFSVTRGNSNWPPSFLDTPFFLGAGKIMAQIQKVLAGFQDAAPEIDTSTTGNQDVSSEAKMDAVKPSSDSPKKERKYHPGARQQLRQPDEVQDIFPGACPKCGSTNLEFIDDDFWVHQILELPELIIKCLHLHVHKARCKHCGTDFSARIPQELTSGYGPRLVALIAVLSGDAGVTRRNIQAFLKNLLGLEVSLGAIDKCIDRASAAIESHYAMALDEARQLDVAHMDETSWRRFGPLGKEKHWIWTLCHGGFAVFKVFEHRSKECFLEFIKDWHGILVSDDYATYKDWPVRQPCLAHLIRTAEKLSESMDSAISAGGQRILAELRRLDQMRQGKTRYGELCAWKARFGRCLKKYASLKNALGTFASRLLDERLQLITFLLEKGVDPTNNRAERALRTPVCRRKVSIGSTSDDGERWIERSLTLRELCRHNGRSYFAELVNAIDCHAHGVVPDLEWIHEARLAECTPVEG